ncbi:MAG TPA: hypothetical protein VH413_04035 [Verrucomicrobiae bacterium]|nr:hypothetical protein [Verrucomicrobiae bacterium]
MKTQSFVLASLSLLIALNLHAQGTSGYVAYGNTENSYVQVTQGRGLVPAPTGGGFEVEMFYQPNNGGAAPTPIDGSLSLGAWQGTKVLDVGTPIPGIFLGGVQSLTGVAPGANAWIEIVGWNNGQQSLANAEASSTLFAFSSVFNILTGNPVAEPPTVPPLTSGPDKFTGLVLGFQGMVFVTPEPSTLALGGLCAVALFGMTRKATK